MFGFYIPNIVLVFNDVLYFQYITFHTNMKFNIIRLFMNIISDYYNYYE